ncbi:MAG: glycosyltransferase [Lachnospiraceae bacterium]|nr:glycosyltransferase [Lachnospiraceae bacterium]
MDNNLISVIVPCYNAKNTITKCIDSLLASEGVSLEIIIADDGSTDGSSGICEALSAAHQNVTHLLLPHRGVSAARNAALRIASGDYIGFADSDDYAEPDMFAELLKPLTEGKAVLSVCGFIREADTYRDILCFPEDTVVSFSEFRNNLFEDERTEGFLFNKLFPASLIKNMFFDESLTYCEDLYFVFSIKAQDDAKVAYSHKALYHYVQSSGSLTGGKSFFKDGTFKYAPAFKLFEQMADERNLKTTIRNKYLKILTYSMNVVMTTNNVHDCHTPEDLKELRLLRRELRRSMMHLSFTSLPTRRQLSLFKSAFYPLSALLRSFDERHRKHSA